MDIVIYAAGMASDQTKVDQYLDDMRIVTAKLQPGQELAAADQSKLREVYLKIEEFLVRSDPLRSFEKDELRSKITKHFGLSGTSSTFWPTL